MLKAMKTSLYKLFALTAAVTAAVVVGCSNDSEAPIAESDEGETPSTREVVPVSMETVNLKISGMT